MSTQGRYNRARKSGDMYKFSRHNFGGNWRMVLVPGVETIPLHIATKLRMMNSGKMYLNPKNIKVH